MNYCPNCGQKVYGGACYSCTSNLVLETERPTQGFVDLHRLDMLAARWREEAEQARKMAKKVKDDNVGMRTIHITRAMMLERCASDLEAAGSGHIDEASRQEPRQ